MCDFNDFNTEKEAVSGNWDSPGLVFLFAPGLHLICEEIEHFELIFSHKGSTSVGPLLIDDTLCLVFQRKK